MFYNGCPFILPLGAQGDNQEYTAVGGHFVDNKVIYPVTEPVGSKILSGEKILQTVYDHIYIFAAVKGIIPIERILPVQEDVGASILSTSASQVFLPHCLLSNKEDHTYIPAPKSLPGFPESNRVSGKTPIQGGGGIRKRWEGKKGVILEWDYQHGEIEMYSKNGKHLGAYNHITGEKVKNPDKKRSIKKFK